MSIPFYWQEHIDKKIKQIVEKQNQIGKDCVSFAMITDIHWSFNAQHCGALLSKVMKECNIPYFFNGGDTFAGFPFCSKESIFQDIKNYRKAFEEIEERCLLVMGNHDAAFTTKPDISACYNENISKAELYDCYFSFLKNYPHRTFGDDAYYFVDDTAQKMRYIVLNTHDIPSDEKDENGFAKYNSFRLFCIREPQLQWLALVALDVPDKDWSVALCSHENPNVISQKHLTRNNPILTGIINAFQNHTHFSMKTQFDDQPFCNAEIDVDYTEKGGNFIAWLGGHEHKDILQTIDNIVCVTTRNDAVRLDGGSAPERIIGTNTEHSFDVFLIDKQNRKGTIIRVGYGEDREFTY